MKTKLYKNGWLFKDLREEDLYSWKEKRRKSYLLEGDRFLKEGRYYLAVLSYKRAGEEEKALEIFYKYLYRKKK